MGTCSGLARLQLEFTSPSMKFSALTLVFAFAMIGATMAAPAKTASHNHKAAEEAKKTITDMLKTGSDSSACADLADSLISTVQNDINDRIAIVAGLPDGSSCTTEGQGVVDAARSSVTEAESAAATAHEAASTAASAPVHFGSINLDSLGELAEGHCTSFESNPAYLAAKSEAEAAAGAAAEADAAVEAAKSAVDSALEEQKRLVEECQCAAHGHAKAAYDEASTVSAEETAAWEKGKHMKCVLAGTAPADCDVGSPDVPAAPALAEGVTEESCHRKGSHWALECTNTHSHLSAAGVITPQAPEGYTMTGGGIKNNIRDFHNAGSAFEEAYPVDNGFRCDMGIGAGNFDCWARSCKQGGRPMQCQTKETSEHIAWLDEGYMMTGGGSVNNHRAFDKFMHFEQSRPHGNTGWATDMSAGHAPEGYKSFVRGCKHLYCITETSERANSAVVTCQPGYQLTGCGAHNWRGWEERGGFEEFRPEGNGCLCDMGFGHGDMQCFARCCKTAGT